MIYQDLRMDFSSRQGRTACFTGPAFLQYFFECSYLEFQIIFP